MSVEVLPLREAKPEADPKMVEMLDELLGWAKKGEILGVALALHLRGHETATSTMVIEGGDVAHLVHAIERLKWRSTGRVRRGRWFLAQVDWPSVCRAPSW